MTFPRLLLTAAFALAPVAYGHFPFVLPAPGGATAELVLSEQMRPDLDVSMAKETRLLLRDEAGKDVALSLTPGKNAYRMELAGRGTRLVHGMADFGIMPGVRAPQPHLLLYYPKAVLGGAVGDKATVGGKPVELVPIGQPGSVSLLLLVAGKPQPDAEVTMILPEGKELKVKTDAQGKTRAFTETGRFGAWARYWETASGERDGKPYGQVRHYATLVFDALPSATSFATLPEPSSSFGAAVDKGWLYVYGGHIVPTHNYSTASVSGKFHRMNLATRQWEALPAGPGRQGLNLAAHGGKVYRVGGMEPRNKPGEKQDIHSVADVARFDPAKGQWEALPPLPEARSSHDVVVIGDTLIVMGGWTLKGAEPTTWAKTIHTLDLSTPGAQWQTAAQPFQRRALIAAVHGGRLYVMGGILPAGEVSTDVDVYDAGTGAWSKGPALPGASINSFAPAACDFEGRLYVSLGDGSLYRLDDADKRWTDVGRSSPRLAHRMVAVGDSLVILGGALKGKNLELVEALPAGAKGKS